MSTEITLIPLEMLEGIKRTWTYEELLSVWKPSPPFYVDEISDNTLYLRYYNPHTGAYFSAYPASLMVVAHGLIPGYSIYYSIWSDELEALKDVEGLWCSERPVFTEGEMDALALHVNFLRPRHFYWEVAHVIARLSGQMQALVAEEEDVDYFVTGLYIPPRITPAMKEYPLLKKVVNKVVKELCPPLHADECFIPFVRDPKFIVPEPHEELEQRAARVMIYTRLTEWPDERDLKSQEKRSRLFSRYFFWWRYMFNYPASALSHTPSQEYYPTPVVPAQITEEEKAVDWRMFGETFVPGIGVNGGTFCSHAYWVALWEEEQKAIFIPWWVQFVVAVDRYRLMRDEGSYHYPKFKTKSSHYPIEAFIDALGKHAERIEEGWLCERPDNELWNQILQETASLTMSTIAPGKLFIFPEQ